MSTFAYTRFELRRTFRNRRFLIFALGFPLVLYFITAGPNRDEANLNGSGISAPVYFMVGMAAWGTMMSMLSTGARISGERAVGWNRQLRITPLSSRSYLATKIATAYATALLALVTMYVAGAILGVRLDAGRWIEMSVLILIGLIPFAALGILIGHLLSTDSIGPAMGGGVGLLGIVSGIWFPLDKGSFLHDIGEQLPSYWLVQAGHVGIGGDGWPAHGWIVLGVWTVVLGSLAARAYRRDTGRQ
ncbi:putative ABC transporter integral membrane protein [Patulibacter medicamentivorans]|jgi:ABC-2 type transport system permease protein|uniref:Putative ABC transporter integral membrane protein n=1 Tax=Patulibacter medicamentivorans TaxID=1097667 RepID=H0EAJ9_9ACTN|nr:ABC transporter permease [Patulibacter medicamentivorans]EHN09326.1 putative ABC transporter integral membrane protein [Patulibacter medicamentivorans]